MLKLRYKKEILLRKIVHATIRVGKAIREILHWVPMHEKVYILLNGACGHETNEAINEYDKNVMIDFNIKKIQIS